MTPYHRIAFAAVFAAFAPSAWAIHVEPDQPDLQNPKTQLVDAGRAAETIINGGTTSLSSSGFTGLNDKVKRKAFPPGYGRSGYQFEDELTGDAPKPDAAGESDAAAQTLPPPAARKP